MIRALLHVVGPEPARTLRHNVAGLVAESVLVGVGFVLLVPLLEAILGSDVRRATLWLGAMVGLLAVYAVVRFRTQLAGYRAAMDLGGSLFQDLGDHIPRLPLGWFDATAVGHIGRLTSQGVIDVMGVPAHLLRPLVSAIVTPVVVALLMFVFDWRLALATLVTAPIAAAVYRWSGRLVERTDHRTHEAATEAAGRVVEFAQAQAVLRAFGQSDRGFEQLDAALREQREAGRLQIFTVVPAFSSFVLVVQLAFTVLLLFGTSLALGGEIDASELIALLVLAARYVEPLVATADLEGALRVSRNSLARMDELLHTKPLAEPSTPARPSGAEVVFDEVRFAYGETPVLDGVAFTVPERTMTAVVGPSGSGKTTLLRLIARFWDVDGGAVRVGGVDVRELATHELMGLLSVVFQDVYLFDGTIEENIRMGDPSAADERVWEAVRLARVDTVVGRLPNGLDTRVGEGGVALSGGERQRVSIARAILKDAPIVLLDEATAALDPINEGAVQDALRALTKDKTLVVVAHCLQTVRAADQIIVLDEGRVIERGAHDELIAAGGKYAAFWNERARAVGWRLGAERPGSAERFGSHT